MGYIFYRYHVACKVPWEVVAIVYSCESCIASYSKIFYVVLCYVQFSILLGQSPQLPNLPLLLLRQSLMSCKVKGFQFKGILILSLPLVVYTGGRAYLILRSSTISMELQQISKELFIAKGNKAYIQINQIKRYHCENQKTKLIQTRLT